jgi:hypothetical protein
METGRKEEYRRRQSLLLAEECALSDVVITTALIGGVFAPRLISADTVKDDEAGIGDRRPRAPTAGATASCRSRAKRSRRRRHDARAAQPAGDDAAPLPACCSRAT